MEFDKQKILVVEDNYISYKLIEAYLQRRNLLLIHAQDGLQAIEMFRAEEDIRIVLMDLQLPKLSGIEVTQKIRKTHPDIPIFATTANVFYEDRAACEEAGFTAFISKPINFTELFVLLKQYLD